MIQRTRHYNESDLTGMAGHSQVGVISITEPDRFVKALDESRWPFVLRLYFHDVDEPWKDRVMFTEAQADEILDWLKEHEDEMTGVYTHCAAGISRSAAVTKFISDVYGCFFDERKGALFNRHVYRVLMERAVERGIITVEKLQEKTMPVLDHSDVDVKFT